MIKRINRKVFTAFLLAILLFTSVIIPGNKAFAKDLDEIRNYEITVDVNDDATLTIHYHIEWEVLDSTSEGPLEWVKIGIPNSHYISITPLSSVIREAGYSSDGGSYARIDFDREYKKGEIVSFDFEVVQDYMYQVDKLKEGETVYEFTPGWFDEIVVDNMTLRWNADKAIAQTPAAYQEDGYYVWQSPLKHKQKYSISVTYPNNAYAFDLSKEIKQGDPTDTYIGIFVFVVILVIGLFIGRSLLLDSYNSGANFSASTKKKVNLTKVVYYSNCPGCGSPRTGESENCPYCGASFIKSEEKITEKDIPNEEKNLKSKKKDGLYAYSSSPHTYVRVHTTYVPVARSSSSYTSRSSGCAHSSCACACACACAGGGRAGCTTKDFYNTNLKLRQLELKKAFKK